MSKRKNMQMAQLLAATMLGGMGMGLPGLGVKMEEPEQPTKCGLPGCDTYTYHNGGYCCGDHCRQHEAQLKAARKAKAQNEKV